MFQQGYRIAVFAALGLLAPGCGQVPEVEPVAAARPVAGDANGDGAVDISDAAYLSDHLFRGGAHPVCFDAVDLFGDGALAASDLWILLSAAMPGQSDLADLGEDQCTGTYEPEIPGARRLAMHLDAPKKASGAFQAAVTLENPGGGVVAWQISVEAEGCAVTELSTAGTAAASIDDDPPGERGRTSWDWHELSQDGGAVAGVLLDWRDDRELAPSQTATTLLKLTVQPGDGDCTLRLRGGQRASGPYSRNLVSVEGWTFLLGGEEVTVKAD